MMILITWMVPVFLQLPFYIENDVSAVAGMFLLIFCLAGFPSFSIIVTSKGICGVDKYAELLVFGYVKLLTSLCSLC